MLRAIEVLQYWETSDPKDAGARVAVRTGRVWKADDAEKEAEVRMCCKVLMKTGAKGGVGCRGTEVPQFRKFQGKEQWQGLR